MTFASGVAVGVAAAAAGVWLWGLWRGGRRLPALRKRPKGEYVVISRPAEFAEKKKRMVLDGVHTLQVISDFDFTLTRFMRNGVRAASTHRVIEDSGLFTEEYHERAKALQRKYYPIEVNPDIPHEEKYPLMVEWFTKAHELLESSGLTREQIRTAVASANIELRPGVQELLHLLDEHNVPMLVFSAGIGDILLEVMRQQASLPNNVHIVSNRMQFDNSGRLVRFREPLFHVYNKRAAAIQHEPYFKEVVSRRNLILLGDNLGDLSMSEGLSMDRSITIGFLNDRIDERLASYMEAYDVVIVNDGSFNFVNELIRSFHVPRSALPSTTAPSPVLRSPEAGAAMSSDHGK